MPDFKSLSSHHETRYSKWAGSPNGYAPDMQKCAESVTPTGQWISSQCSRARGHGDEQAFCKQHAKWHTTSKL